MSKNAFALSDQKSNVGFKPCIQNGEPVPNSTFSSFKPIAFSGFKPNVSEENPKIPPKNEKKSKFQILKEKIKDQKFTDTEKSELA